jgi:hypothetical protein
VKRWHYLAAAGAGAAVFFALNKPTPAQLLAARSLDRLSNLVAVCEREWAAKVREQGGNTDTGPRVNEYQRIVGLSGGDAWCMAFVQWCISTSLGQIRKVGWGGGSCSGVFANVEKLLRSGHLDPSFVVYENDPNKRTKVKPGWVWIRKGHTGIVTSLVGAKPDTFQCIEGNTWLAEEGWGVLRQNHAWNKSALPVGDERDSRNVAWFDPFAANDAYLASRANA